MLAVLQLLAAVVLVDHRPAGASRRRRPAHAAKRARALPTAHGQRGSSEEHVHLRRGDTLAHVLAARGVGPTEARSWIEAAARVYDLRRLRPRRGLTFRFDRATHALEAIHYEMDDHSLLVVERTPDGIRAERASLPYFVEVKGVAGRIERGLREDAAASDVPARVVSALADIFGWELDLENDLRPGDEFRVLYENTWQAGAARPEAGNVLGAEIVTGGQSLTAVFYEDADGNGGYYRPTGDPLSREILRYPVEFTEITSEFALMRRHPILHRLRPHLGVDLAAPRGTPVRAVASGTVREAGRAHQLGRCVRIEHAETLTSVYGHLARIAEGIHEGTAVERGQVIGYVGSSGLSTGPHLHFGMERGGEYVDPLALTASAAVALPDAARRPFERAQSAISRQLAALQHGEPPLTVSLSAPGLPPE